jgi:hypothetical protein
MVKAAELGRGDHQGQHLKYRGYVDTYEVILVDRTTLITHMSF